jgi:hypothetical protein
MNEKKQRIFNPEDGSTPSSYMRSYEFAVKDFYEEASGKARDDMRHSQRAFLDEIKLTYERGADEHKLYKNDVIRTRIWRFC